nr:hypothetical protein [Tanacetum cinerariifolium]
MDRSIEVTNPVGVPVNGPTSNIEDAFSSTNTPDYTSASPDYFLTSSRNTSSVSLNNSSCLVPIASPTLSLLHDDPYMKFMHAYDAIIPPQVPIPPSTILPTSLMLSPICNPQEFFLHEELLPPKKRGRERSSFSTSSIPQAFEIGESSHKTRLKCYEEQIKEILIYLDELSLDYTEHMEDKIEEARAQIAGLQRKQMRHNDKISLARFKISTLELIIEDIQILILCYLVNVDRMAPKRTSTSAAPAMTHVAIKKLVADSVVVALEAQAATMANADNTNRNARPRETLVAKK